MKKIFPLIISSFLLNSCSNNYISSIKNEYDITIENLWYFFDYEISKEIQSNSQEELYISFNGILLNALYDNVTIELNLNYLLNNEKNIEKHFLYLKGNGNGYYSLSSYYETNKGTTLLYCNRYLEINNVKGKIIFF